jgi:hypothetical protein
MRPAFVLIFLAASAPAVDLGALRAITGGPFEASGVTVPPGGKGLLFVDDARSDAVLWMDLAADGSSKSRPVPVPLGVNVVDPEGLATDGRYVYVVGSQSRGKVRGGVGLVRFRFDSTRGAAEGAETVEDLASLLEGALPGLRPAGKKKKSPLNIEGLAWDAKGGRLLLGLRAPLDGGRAMLVPLKVVDAAGALVAANLRVEQPIRLDLGGAGIRGIEADAAGGYWIIAGGATGNPHPARLVRWDGGGSAVQAVSTFPASLKPEGVARTVVGGKPVTLVLCDTSQYLLLP